MSHYLWRHVSFGFRILLGTRHVKLMIHSKSWVERNPSADKNRQFGRPILTYDDGGDDVRRTPWNQRKDD